MLPKAGNSDILVLAEGREGGQMSMYTVEALKFLLIPIAKRYGLKKLSVFGSVARGDATEQSDVDLLVEVPKDWGLLELGGLYADIEDVVSCSIDLVTTGIEDREFLSRIQQDEVVLYEQ